MHDIASDNCRQAAFMHHAAACAYILVNIDKHARMLYLAEIRGRLRSEPRQGHEGQPYK